MIRGFQWGGVLPRLDSSGSDPASITARTFRGQPVRLRVGAHTWHPGNLGSLRSQRPPWADGSITLGEQVDIVRRHRCPVLVCCDVMHPGAPNESDKPGNGYHAREGDGRVGYPNRFDPETVVKWVKDALGVFQSRGVHVVGVELGNEIDYAPYISAGDTVAAYEVYGRAFVAVCQRFPNYPVICGGLRPGADGGGGRPGLAWWLGGWPNLPPNARAGFHKPLGQEVTPESVRAAAASLRQRWGKLPWYTEFAGRERMDVLGQAAEDGGAEAAFMIAGEWFGETWSVRWPPPGSAIGNARTLGVIDWRGQVVRPNLGAWCRFTGQAIPNLDGPGEPEPPHDPPDEPEEPMPDPEPIDRSDFYRALYRLIRRGTSGELHSAHQAARDRNERGGGFANRADELLDELKRLV